MAKKKKADPRLVALHEKADKARAEFERWYRKLKRAFTGCEKAKGRLVRLQKRIECFDADKQEQDGRASPDAIYADGL